MRKSYLSLVILLLVFVVSGCGRSSNGIVGDIIDDTPPTVQSVSPINDSTDISVSTAISVTFSEAMDTASAEGAFSTNPTTTGTFSWNGDNTVMIFTPGSRLHYGTTYTCTISIDAQDDAGNNLASQYQWSYTTINGRPDYGWTKRIGGSSNDMAYSITTDSSGNVYVAGFFYNTVDFGADFGVADSKTAAGGQDIFITKINANGTYAWTKRMGGSDSESVQGITTDSSGNVYVTGYFFSTVDFGADFGVADSKTPAGGAGVYADIFITKINANGTYGWTKQMGGSSGSDLGYSITTDSSGNVYVTGAFRGTVDFGADFGVADSKTCAPGVFDIFITKINANGTYAWTKQMGGGSNDTYGYGISTDSSGNVYVTGYFLSTVDFGADFGVTDSKTSAGAQDIFITKINANGTYAWTKRMGGSSIDYGYGITTDSSGDVYVTGFFLSTVDFGADFGVADSKTAAGGYTDIFITKINANGTYAWTKQMGGSLGDRGNSITTDPSGNVYVTGFFAGTVDFGADFGVADSKTSAGGVHDDIYITKINADGTYGWTKQMGGSSSNDGGYSITTDPSGNVYVTGYFAGTVDFGADFGVADSKTSAGGTDIFITKVVP